MLGLSSGSTPPPAACEIHACEAAMVGDSVLIRTHMLIKLVYYDGDKALMKKPISFLFLKISACAA